VEVIGVDRGAMRARPTAASCALGSSARRARLAPVREEEEDGQLGCEGELGQPRGRGPVGRGGRLVEKKRKWAAAGPKGRMGRK
jgi:hypothetical protein